MENSSSALGTAGIRKIGDDRKMTSGGVAKKISKAASAAQTSAAK
jgi:hypothetical protein